MTRPKARWVTPTIWILAILVVVAGFAANRMQYDRLFDLYTQQNQQLRDNGIQPKTPSPGLVAQAGPAGTPGDTGARGPGPTAEQIDTAVRDYCYARLGCVGATGAPGAASTVPGPQGGTGSTGADSTVPGPAGAAGQDSTVPGPAGADGQPPMSWTQPGLTPNSTVTCTRTEPFDPSAPTYTCAPTPEGATP